MLQLPNIKPSENDNSLTFLLIPIVRDKTRWTEKFHLKEMDIQGYTLTSLGHEKFIERSDIADIRGWLTDETLRQILLLDPEFRQIDGDEVHIAGPSWLAQWAMDGMDKPIDTPDFLQKQNHHTRLAGIIVPWCARDNHWVVIYISLEHRKAILYDSLSYFSSPSMWRTTHSGHLRRAVRLATEFHRLYQGHFNQNARPFRVVEGRMYTSAGFLKLWYLCPQKYFSPAKKTAT